MYFEQLPLARSSLKQVKYTTAKIFFRDSKDLLVYLSDPLKSKLTIAAYVW